MLSDSERASPGSPARPVLACWGGNATEEESKHPEGVSSAMAAQGISTRGRPRNNRMFGKVLPERLTTDSAVRERRCGRSLVEIPCIGIARESRSGCFDSSFFLRFAQSESLSMTGVEGVVLLVDSGLGYGLSFQHDGGAKAIPPQRSWHYLRTWRSSMD